VTAPPPGRLVALYLPAIAVQWGLVAYVSRLGRGRNFLPELLGRRWTSVARAGTDMALACAGWLLIEGAEFAFARMFGSSHGARSAILPLTELERVVWCAFAISAGFCEEVVYRGYLQGQLGGWTHSLNAGIFLQAVLFGLAHADQGGWAAVRLGLYGFGLGLLARYRGSLVPGILCHVGIDLATGLWLR
jgi:membrane protease YdiL (CAAX protease family)